MQLNASILSTIYIFHKLCCIYSLIFQIVPLFLQKPVYKKFFDECQILYQHVLFKKKYNIKLLRQNKNHHETFAQAVGVFYEFYEENEITVFWITPWFLWASARKT